MQVLQAESAAPMSNERCVDISHVNLVFGPVGSSLISAVLDLLKESMPFVFDGL